MRRLARMVKESERLSKHSIVTLINNKVRTFFSAYTSKYEEVEENTEKLFA